MELLQVIDLHKLHEYSNIDVSHLDIKYTTSQAIAKLDYDKFNQFIDIFKDVHQSFITFMNPTVGDIILYVLYYDELFCNFTPNQYIMIHLKLLHKGFTKCFFDNDKQTALINHRLYANTKQYVSKYYNTILNLFRLTNGDDIQICNLNDNSFDTFNILLLICKTRVVPKYIVLHKILFFYLC